MVYIPFTTLGDWDAYGCKVPLDAQRFVRQLRLPSGYPYPDYSFTGFGGVLMVCDVFSNVRAFDLCCPVELNPDIRVYIDHNANCAKCPKCGSTYDVFLLNGSGRLAGGPLSGPALTDGFGLRNYNVLFGVDGRYCLISQ